MLILKLNVRLCLCCSLSSWTVRLISNDLYLCICTRTVEGTMDGEQVNIMQPMAADEGNNTLVSVHPADYPAIRPLVRFFVRPSVKLGIKTKVNAECVFASETMQDFVTRPLYAILLG